MFAGCARSGISSISKTGDMISKWKFCTYDMLTAYFPSCLWETSFKNNVKFSSRERACGYM